MISINWSDYPNFDRYEFECRCGCGRADMNPAFLERLQSLRSEVGALVVTSGFRCPNHPEERKKKRPGAHSIGRAADILSHSSDRYSVLKMAFLLNFKGIGVAKTFIHLDTGHPFISRPALWSY